MKKITLIAALVLAVVAAPAQAKPSKPPKPSPPAPHKCVPHMDAYEIEGTLDSGSLTAGVHGIYSGTLTVFVNHANDHAKADRGTHKSYALSNAHANVHHANTVSLAAGSRVDLDGTITTLARNCSQTGFTPTITIQRADIKPPTPHH
jgi:hypothetical protein